MFRALAKGVELDVNERNAQLEQSNGDFADRVLDRSQLDRCLGKAPSTGSAPSQALASHRAQMRPTTLKLEPNSAAPHESGRPQQMAGRDLFPWGDPVAYVHFGSLLSAQPDYFQRAGTGVRRTCPGLNNSVRPQTRLRRFSIE